MKKATTIFFLGLLLGSSQLTKAQPKTVDEIKTYICQYKWFLRRFEQDDKYFTVPKDEQGKRMVFKSNGKMYYYMPGENEGDRPQYSWTLTGDKLKITYLTGGTNTFKFRLENFIGYKIYTTDLADNDNPTYVWEQAEKITTTTSAGTITSPANNSNAGGGSILSSSSDLANAIPTNSTRPQWYTSFAKGKNMGLQSWVKRPEFPEKDIEEKWKNGYYITDIAYGGETDKWFVTFSKINYTHQIWRTRYKRADLLESMSQMWKDNPNYSITHVSFENGLWVMVGSEGSGQGHQYVIKSDEFPDEDIRSYWVKNYYVTSMAYGEAGWIVVLTTGVKFANQRYKVYDSWDHTKIYSQKDEGFCLSAVVKSKGKWYAILDKDNGMDKFDYKAAGELIPSTGISSFWDKGFSIYRTIFIPGVSQQ
jgi:hypothetical protein